MSAPPTGAEPTDVNRDYCECCGFGGELLCCDSCPASFHLLCAEPPLRSADLTDGDYYCKQCRSASEGRNHGDSHLAFLKLATTVARLNSSVFSLPPTLFTDAKKAAKSGTLPYGIESFGRLNRSAEGVLPAGASCNVCKFGRLCDLCVSDELSLGIDWTCPCHYRSQQPESVQVLDPDFRFKIGFGPRYEPPELKLIEKRVEPIIPPGDQQHPRKMEWLYNMSLFQHALRVRPPPVSPAQPHVDAAAQAAEQRARLEALVDLRASLYRQALPSSAHALSPVAAAAQAAGVGTSNDSVNEAFGALMKPLAAQFAAWRRLMHVNQQLATLAALPPSTAAALVAAAPSQSQLAVPVDMQLQQQQQQRTDSVAAAVAQRFHDTSAFVAGVEAEREQAMLSRLAAGDTPRAAAEDERDDTVDALTDIAMDEHDGRGRKRTADERDTAFAAGDNESGGEDEDAEIAAATAHADGYVSEPRERSASGMAQDDAAALLRSRNMRRRTQALAAAAAADAAAAALAQAERDAEPPVTVPGMLVHLTLEGGRREWVQAPPLTIGRPGRDHMPVAVDVTLMRLKAVEVARVSHKHCTIVYDHGEGRFVLVSRSKNGTTVDGTLYRDQPAPLHNGSVIRVGAVGFVFHTQAT